LEFGVNKPQLSPGASRRSEFSIGCGMGWGGIVAIVFGIVVFVWPKALAYVVGAFLVVFGVITLISIWG